jgi:hypothetical protein
LKQVHNSELAVGLRSKRQNEPNDTADEAADASHPLHDLQECHLENPSRFRLGLESNKDSERKDYYSNDGLDRSKHHGGIADVSWGVFEASLMGLRDVLLMMPAVIP